MTGILTLAGRIQVGVIGRAHGVRGWVKVTSHTTDPAGLTAYSPLSDSEGRGYTLRWMAEGIAEVSRVVDGTPVKVTNRSAAERLTNTKLFIDRTALPPTGEEEYYLVDLIGLSAVDTAGSVVGTVAVVHDYGAGASLEVVRTEAPLIIPFTLASVPTVDIAGGQIIVVLPNEIVAAPKTEKASSSLTKEDVA